MKYLTILILISFSFTLSNAQVLYSPQDLYDPPAGLFDTDSLRTIALTFYEPNFYDTLVTAWFNETGLRLPATLTMGNLVLDSVAVRFKGNSTFYVAATNNIEKVPYNIDMNDYVSGQKLLGYKKLKLANALFDPTFVKEMTGYRLYQNYLPSPQANLMKLNVQGNYMGLYVNTESIGSDFLKKHFGEKDGTLFKCDPSAQYGSGAPFLGSNLLWYGADTTLYAGRYQLKSDSLSDWFELLELIDVLNNDPANIDTILNVDRVLWYFALNQVLANTDTYNYLVLHNYYLYRTEDGLFQIIPWDLSETFIGAMLDWLGDPNILYQMSPYLGYSPLQTEMPLVYRLLDNPTWHKQYTAHLRTIIDEQLTDTTVILNMASEAQALGYTAAQQDPWKFFSMAQYSSNLFDWMPFSTIQIAGIMRTVSERKAYLATHPELLKLPPEINAVHQSDSFPMAGDSTYITTDVTGASQVDLMVTISPYKSKFQAVSMVDDGTTGDALAADGIYTALVPFNAVGDEVKYYIRTQNTDAMSLSPRRAEYEFYQYTVTPSVNLIQLLDERLLNVFPNPTETTASIDFGTGIIERLEVIDVTGKLVRSVINIQNNFYTLDCSELATGTYLLKVKTDKGLINKGLIKN
jgi:hypothetical protein